MKLGARIIKTGVAIVLALYLAELLNLPSPAFAGIAAIFAIQPTILRSYHTMIEQIQGNIIGALVAVIFVLLFGNDIFIIGLAVIIVITINLRLKMDKTIVLSIVTVIAIMESQQGAFLTFAFIRFSSVMLGILSSFLVNLIFIPPKYEAKLYTQLSDVTEDIIKWIRISSRHASEHTLLKKDISRIKDELLRLEQIYSMYKEERSYLKKHIQPKSRKFVVYRQMIVTTKKAFETLKRIHKFENEVSLMPEEFQSQLQHHVDRLIHKHEQLLLKHIGKIKTTTSFEEWNGDCFSRHELLMVFFEQQQKLDREHRDMFARTVPLISAINEYDEQLEHLEKLIHSFQSFHKQENHITVENEE
ncbi:aromatic acid exporter family protein [Peribacillus psychrosaccharolyticus]|uniref:Aromatic acid exporter family protein n=2 Tax=Peribacillus psychrosaccharolyticus TaxID=1407 RepID=A0A974S264_PERPY|nr:aromatic acid exporter family protein [Peribacillus psychrosaccharolyticus]MEC2057197.1 aromatic acid exporter family protein [Peribacillus psychrosaccharolyticus]MED3745120.1 aromatic acid exporter family protein [Peribacillus psychrosaccharolyticus]QQT02274.1 aromatic acid exporter family protein [Peribacillus psychrosaccharolyticus]